MSTENRDIKFIKGIGEKRAQLFQKRLGLSSLRDLLTFYPRAYEDWSNPCRICDVTVGENLCIRAKIASEIEEKTSYRTKVTTYSFYIYDRTGQIKVVLFNNRYLAATLQKDAEYLFYGKVKWNGTFREMDSPEIRGTEHMKIRPIYHATEGLPSRMIEKIMQNALEYGDGEENLPPSVVLQNRLMSHAKAIRQIHFPEDYDALSLARERLAFEELFFLRLGFFALKQRSRGNTAKPIQPVDPTEINALFPFSLTDAQTRVIQECMNDLSKTTPMNRLVQGDVGSGKTAVAAALCYACRKSGYMSVMLAPTELLAQQHYDTLCRFFDDSGFRIVLLTGSVSAKEKKDIKKRLKNGQVDIAVATHAILTEDVSLPRTALVITDEQHRFGVAQRAVLSQKADSPHTLVMSATPIPRTLGLVVYGDLDISVIDQLPAGRAAIHSYYVDTALRQRALNYVAKHLDEGYQGYIVCPSIEEDAENDLKAAVQYAEQLKQGNLGKYSIGLLHGRMKPKEKESVMRDFLAGKIQLLVSTTVIEVGIDVPNAVIMVVENAERFGLSQLHQLRGRIGRGTAESTCIFISGATGEQAVKRLKTICSTTDGFKIAEADLRLRGPGNFLGQEQHGLPHLKVADMVNDQAIMTKAATAAEAVFQADPHLQKPEHQALKEEVQYLFGADRQVEFN